MFLINVYGVDKEVLVL